MEFNTFEESLRMWCEEEVGRPVGLVEIPGKNPNIPYAILQRINSPRGEGDNKDPESHREYVFQVLSVGRSPRQAAYMSDRMRTVLIGRNATTGQYLHDISTLPNVPNDPDTPAGPAEPPGIQVLPGSRYSDAAGAIVKSGDTVFQVVDTYRFKVANT